VAICQIVAFGAKFVNCGHDSVNSGPIGANSAENSVNSVPVPALRGGCLGALRLSLSVPAACDWFSVSAVLPVWLVAVLSVPWGLSVRWLLLFLRLILWHSADLQRFGADSGLVPIWARFRLPLRIEQISVRLLQLTFGLPAGLLYFAGFMPWCLSRGCLSRLLSGMFP
jgi:hypothetical protein